MNDETKIVGTAALLAVLFLPTKYLGFAGLGVLAYYGLKNA